MVVSPTKPKNKIIENKKKKKNNETKTKGYTKYLQKVFLHVQSKNHVCTQPKSYKSVVYVI